MEVPLLHSSQVSDVSIKELLVGCSRPLIFSLSTAFKAKEENPFVGGRFLSLGQCDIPLPYFRLTPKK